MDAKCAGAGDGDSGAIDGAWKELREEDIMTI